MGEVRGWGGAVSGKERGRGGRRVLVTAPTLLGPPETATQPQTSPKQPAPHPENAPTPNPSPHPQVGQRGGARLRRHRRQRRVAGAHGVGGHALAVSKVEEENVEAGLRGVDLFGWGCFLSLGGLVLRGSAWYLRRTCVV